MDEQQLFIAIGRLQEGQSAVRTAVVELTTSTDALTEKVNTLPCAVHSGDIETLMAWKTQRNGNNQAVNLEKLKGSISLKNAIIGGITIALVSNIPSIILICTALAGK